MAESEIPPKYSTSAYRRWGITLFILQLFFFVFKEFDGLFGQDSYGYLNDANALILWMQDGTQPPDFFWTRGYSGLGAFLGYPLNDAHPPLILISIASHIGLSIVCMRWAEQLYPRRNGMAAFVAICVTLSPFLFRNGITIQSDMFAIFCCTFGAWQAHRFWLTGKLKHLAWAAFALGFAVAVRYAVIPLVLAPGFALAWKCHQLKKWRWLPLLLLAPLPFLPDWFIFPGSTASLDHGNVMAWSPLNFFRSEFQNMDGHSVFPYPNIIYLLKPIWHPGILGIGMLAWIGFALSIKIWDWKRTVWLLIPPALYLLLIGGIPFQNDRFLLPLIPWLALFLFPAWEQLSIRVMDLPQSPVLKRIGWPVMVLIAAMLTLRGPQAMVERSRAEQRMGADLSSRYLGRRIYALSAVAMLQTRCKDLEVVSLFDDEIPAPRTGDLVLSDFHRSYDQWKEMAPGRHWDEIQARYSLDSLGSYEPEWRLYEVR